jgi:hypothetical protein
MKKTICLFVITLTFCLASVAARAATTDNPPTKEAIAAMSPEERQARVEEIKSRIAEIKSEDRSQMTKAERKAYRAELKALKQETKMYDVLYIGVGALVVLIILLLIIL